MRGLLTASHTPAYLLRCRCFTMMTARGAARGVVRGAGASDTTAVMMRIVTATMIMTITTADAVGSARCPQRPCGRVALSIAGNGHQKRLQLLSGEEKQTKQL